MGEEEVDYGRAEGGGQARPDAVAAPRPSERLYAFGDFQLLPDRQLLLHDGEPVRIGSRALDILTILIQRAGEVVTNAEIRAYVWPDTFVHEGNLKVNVAALRKALAVASGDPRIILNVPGRGYCLTSPVRVEGRGGVAARRAAAARAKAMAAPVRLIGRDGEIAAIAALAGRQPLTTIVGPGGVGKTTVAWAAAERIVAGGGPAACFVDLAAIDDPQTVAHAVAAALGSRADLADLLGGIGAHLRATPRLLILDNCEHVLAAVAAVAEHLAADLPAGTGGSAVLATSREPLRARLEHVYRLHPLACPPQDRAITAALAMDYPAVELFALRAAQAGYVLSDADADPISRICTRLDGVPLALELAATRLDVHPPAHLLALLQHTFAPLRHEDVAAPARQRTLTATLDWSYGLLSDAEARVLRFAAIFARDFTLEDAAAVIGDAGLDPTDVVTAMESLVAKSFALADLSHGVRRYRLFESSRSYALSRLEAQGELEDARRAHAGHFVTIIERAEQECDWREAEDWKAIYGPHVDDLRRAIGWAFGPTGDGLTGVRLTSAAIPLWGVLGLLDESRRHADVARTVARGLPDCDPKLRMTLGASRAWSLTYTEQQTPEAVATWREVLELARETGDTEHQLRALHGLATQETFVGRSHDAIEHLLEFKSIAERAQAWGVLPDALRLLALARIYVGELSEGADMLEHLATRFDRVETRARATRFAVDRYCIIRSSLAFARWLRGQSESAWAAAGAAVAAAVEIDHQVSHSNSLAFAGVPIALWCGRLDEAEAGVVAMRGNLAVRNTAIWTRVTRFFEAAVHQARGGRSAVGEMGEALDDLLATGLVTRAPMYLAMLAQALLDAGDIDAAEARVADAARRLDQTRERWCRAELLRLRGLVALARGDVAAARSDLAQAIADARAQGALTFELRAARSLAELLAAQGDGAAALATLAPVCATFAETGDNPDLAAALARLDALR